MRDFKALLDAIETYFDVIYDCDVEKLGERGWRIVAKVWHLERIVPIQTRP